MSDYDLVRRVQQVTIPRTIRPRLLAILGVQTEHQKNRAPTHGRCKYCPTQHLPEGWKNWKVAITDQKSLFDDGIEPQVINKLRFALPTVGLAKAGSEKFVRKDIS
nr:unnamed protein product [Callosobruchus analis]